MKLLAKAWVKQPLVQILVVVANIQMRTLKAEVEKGSVWTAFGHGLVDPKRWGNPVSRAQFRAAHRKGIGLIFPNRDAEADGNVSEPGDAGGSPGKSSLFFLTARKPWNRIIRR